MWSSGLEGRNGGFPSCLGTSVEPGGHIQAHLRVRLSVFFFLFLVQPTTLQQGTAFFFFLVFLCFSLFHFRCVVSLFFFCACIRAFFFYFSIRGSVLFCFVLSASLFFFFFFLCSLACSFSLVSFLSLSFFFFLLVSSLCFVPVLSNSSFGIFLHSFSQFFFFFVTMIYVHREAPSFFFFLNSVEPRCDKVVLFSPLTEGRGRGEGKKKERNKHHCEVFMMIKKRKTNKQPSSPLYLQIRPCQKQRPHFIILKKKKKKRQEKKKKEHTGRKCWGAQL